MFASQRQKRLFGYWQASARQRVVAGALFLFIGGLFTVGFLAAGGKIDIERWFGICGFKQRYSLPCPACGITTAVLEFARGRVFKAFYIQPAGALLSLALAVAAVLSLITVVFGVYFEFLRRLFAETKIRIFVLVLLGVFAAGWAVTLARALVAASG